MGQKPKPGPGTDPAQKAATPKAKPGGDAIAPREEKTPVALPPKVRILVARLPGNMKAADTNGPVAEFAYKVGTTAEIPKGAKDKKAGADGTFEVRLPDGGVRIGAFGTEFQAFLFSPMGDAAGMAWQKLGYLGYHDSMDGTTHPVDILRFQLDNDLVTTGLLDKPTLDEIDAAYTKRESDFPISK